MILLGSEWYPSVELEYSEGNAAATSPVCQGAAPSSSRHTPFTNYDSFIILGDEHIPLLLRKLHHLENKWEEIGKALRIPLDTIVNTRTCGTDLIKLYNILQAFVSFHGKPTLHLLNEGLRSHAVDGAQYEVTEEDLSLHRNHVCNNNEKYKKAYQEIIKNEKQVLKVLFAKLIFLGPPERGKTLTRLRLENGVKNIASDLKYNSNPSTLMAKNETYLITDLSKSTALLSERGWKHLKEKREEVHFLYQLFLKLKEEMELQTTTSEAASQSPASLDTASTSTSSSEILQVFDESFVTGTWEELAGHLDKMTLLYMKDTGGQPELMDMLPALIIGPALYLLFCRYGDNLDETYKVSLRGADNCKIPDRMSNCTVRQNLTSALSSIFSMQSYSTVQARDDSLLKNLTQNSPKSVAYIVCTHKDKVSSQEMINFDKKMQKDLKDTIFVGKELVHFVSDDGFESNDSKDEFPGGMKRLIFPIDNYNGTEEEIEGLQKFIQKALDKFPRPEIPARWLPFSLFLRYNKKKYVDLDTCYQSGKHLRMNKEETDVALWFFHHYTGIIYYFPNVPELKDFVITDTQLVFDSISRLIFETGVDLRPNAGEKLRKVGQISFADIKKVSADVFPPETLESLLRHVHVIAPLRKSLTEEKFVDRDAAQLYFMPCVLQNLSEEELDAEIERINNNAKVFILKVYFISGFVPIGVFPSLIASLVGQASKEVIYIHEITFLLCNINIIFKISRL